MPCLLFLLLQCQLITLSAAFARPSPPIPSPTATIPDKNNDIQISVATTNDDIISLANLRYQEWMANDPNPPNPSVWRMASAEIFHERRVQGSIVSIAKIMSNNDDDDSGYATVGAAELSPIEFLGVFSDETIISQIKPLYITDVVTSSSYRRLGIGSKLMDNIERIAYEMDSKCVFLHVEYSNIGAIDFYKRLRYTALEEGSIGGDTTYNAATINDGSMSFSLKDAGIINLNTKRFADNAGTVGQLLMMKELSDPQLLEDKMPLQIRPESAASSSVSVGGFGKQNVSQKKKQKKRKR